MATLVELTAKKFKRREAAYLTTIFGGIVLAAINAATLIPEHGVTGTIGKYLHVLLCLAAVFGLVGFSINRIAIWWHHG